MPSSVRFYLLLGDSRKSVFVEPLGASEPRRIVVRDGANGGEEGCGVGHLAARLEIVVGQSSGTHDRFSRASFQKLVPMNRYRNRKSIRWPAVNMVRALDPFQCPSMSFEHSTHMFAVGASYFDGLSDWVSGVNNHFDIAILHDFENAFKRLPYVRERFFHSITA